MKVFNFGIGLCLGILLILLPMRLSSSSPLDSFQTLAVQVDGQVRPLAAVATETITAIHGLAHYDSSQGKSLNALETYLALWFNDRDWNQEPFVVLKDRTLKSDLALAPDRQYFSFQELYQSNLRSIAQQAHDQQLDLSRTEREALAVESRLALLRATVAAEDLPVVPHPSDPEGTWVGLNQAQIYYPPESVAPLIAQFQVIQRVYRLGPEHFEALGPVVESVKDTLFHLSPAVYPDQSIFQQEVEYSKWHLLRKAEILYAIAFMALLGSHFQINSLYPCGIGFFVVGLLSHLFEIGWQVEITGYPPLTTWDGSLVYIGLGMAGFALVVELMAKTRYYLLAAAPLSIVLLALVDQWPSILAAVPLSILERWLGQ